MNPEFPSPPNYQRSGGEGYFGQSLNITAATPAPRYLVRAVLDADLHACDEAQATVLYYGVDEHGDMKVIRREDGGAMIIVRDVLGIVSGDLLAKYGSDGRLYIPSGTNVLCYRPLDAYDGHHEPIAFGAVCEGSGSGSGSGSEGSDGSGSESGSGSGESGSGESGSGESGSGSGCTDYRLPPCPEDASITNKYVLVCDGSGCPRWELTQPCNPSSGSSGGEL